MPSFFKVAFIEPLRNIKEAPRMNKIKANSIETGCAVIANLFSWSDQKICSALCFSLTCALICMIYWFMNDAKLIYILRVFSTFRLFQRFTCQLPSSPKLAGWRLIISKRIDWWGFLQSFPVFYSLTRIPCHTFYIWRLIPYSKLVFLLSRFVKIIALIKD